MFNIESTIICIKNDNKLPENHEKILLMDYECQPFGEKGILYTLGEACELYKTLQVSQFSKALYKTLQKYSKDYRLLERGKVTDNISNMYWWYNINLSSLGESEVEVFRVYRFQIIEHFLTISLINARSFALIPSH